VFLIDGELADGYPVGDSDPQVGAVSEQLAVLLAHDLLAGEPHGVVEYHHGGVVRVMRQNRSTSQALGRP
jgi:hypothetical protein